MKQNGNSILCSICGVAIRNDNKGVFYTNKFPICSNCCTTKNTRWFHTACIIYSTFEYRDTFENLFKFTIDYSIQRKKRIYSRKKFLSTPRGRCLQYIAKVTPQRAKVLEVGCGWGFDGNELKKLRPDIEYIGLDFSETSLSYAKQYFGLDCRCASANTLSAFNKNQFDLMFSFETLEHLQNITQHLANAHRILKLKGSYIFHYPNRFYYPYPLTKVGAIKQTLVYPLTKVGTIRKILVKLKRTPNLVIKEKFQELLSLLRDLFNELPVMKTDPLTFISHPNFLFPQELYAILEYFNFKKVYATVARDCFGHFVKVKNNLINTKKL